MRKLYNYIKNNDGLSFAVYLVVLILFNGIVSRFKYGYIIGYVPVFILFVLKLIAIYYQRKELKAKGLTFGDVSNIVFVKAWEVTRKTGMRRYCLLEGGLITGIILFIPFSFALFFTAGLDKILASSTNLLIASLTSFVAAYIIGFATYYFRWQTNERRFTRLTDPLSLLG